MFKGKNRKIINTPAIPSFATLKWGVRGYKPQGRVNLMFLIPPYPKSRHHLYADLYVNMETFSMSFILYTGCSSLELKGQRDREIIVITRLVMSLEAMKWLCKRNPSSNKRARQHANMSVKCTPPYTPLLYSKTGVYRGIHHFLIFALKHKLWVLVRTASLFLQT